MAIETINPSTGETIQTYQPMSDAELEAKLVRAYETWQSYRWSSFSYRTAKMLRAAEILDKEKEAFGRLMTLEMGKPIRAAREEAAKCALACLYYSENTERFLADQVVETRADRSFIRFLPIGPVLAIMPWNFPFWQVFRFAAPALMAGNVGLLKHASNVPQCALVIEDIFRRAGFPEGAFQNLFIESARVPQVLDDPRVAAATLTGSEAAGRSVGAEAGKRIKKTVLELGGSDPFIVMPSANLDEAVKTAVTARIINNGQSCIAAKRFIVHDAIYDEFERRFVAGMEALRVGDPMDEETDIGPLATESILQDLEGQVQRTIQAGARLLTGGQRLERRGFYYPPTALAIAPDPMIAPDLQSGAHTTGRICNPSPAYQEELFGPVALLFRAKNVEEAITLANDTPFGLGSSVWTNDEAERERFINEIEAGMTFINAMVASDPRMPFGGVKRSGYGRELGELGIREFVNVKTVWVKEGEGARRSGTE